MARKATLPVVPLLSVLALVAATPNGQGPKIKAEDALRRAVAKSGSERGYTAEGVIRIKMGVGSPLPEFDLPISIVTFGPEEMWVKSKGPQWKLQLVTDARGTWLYMPRANEYAEVGSLEWEHEFVTPGTVMVGSLVAAGRMLQSATLTKRFRQPTIREGKCALPSGKSAECYVVQADYRPAWSDAGNRPWSESYRVESSSSTLWVDETQFDILRERAFFKCLYITSLALHEVAVTTSLERIESIGKIPANPISFTAPTGARSVAVADLVGELSVQAQKIVTASRETQ